MVNLEEARPKSVPGAPSGGKDGNGPGSGFGESSSC